MEDMLQEINNLLAEHNGQDVAVLDLRKYKTWTDYFIIVTATSSTHAHGLERHIKEFCRMREIELIGSSRKKTDDEWRLLELSKPCGSVIIHLMSKRLREFYELERLWAPNSII